MKEGGQRTNNGRMVSPVDLASGRSRVQGEKEDFQYDTDKRQLFKADMRSKLI